MSENSYPIFFVPLEGPVEKISGHFLILVQPHDDKWLKPAAQHRMTKGNINLYATVVNVSGKACGAIEKYSRWIFRYVLLESGKFFAVLIIEPLHLEVQIHIICTFAQALLLML